MIQTKEKDVIQELSKLMDDIHDEIMELQRIYDDAQDEKNFLSRTFSEEINWDQCSWYHGDKKCELDNSW